jgi:hypothetical protein
MQHILYLLVCLLIIKIIIDKFQDTGYIYDDICYFSLDKSHYNKQIYGQFIANNGNRYIGHVQYGKPHGKGECYVKSEKVTYIGMYKNGKLIYLSDVKNLKNSKSLKIS